MYGIIHPCYITYEALLTAGHVMSAGLVHTSTGNASLVRPLNIIIPQSRTAVTNPAPTSHEMNTAEELAVP